jgi:hypothetical protein
VAPHVLIYAGSLRRVVFLGHAYGGDLLERIRHLQVRLVASVEALYGLSGNGLTVPARVKRLRGRTRRILRDPVHRTDRSMRTECHSQLETLFLAVQLYSYPGQYLDRPTVDRIAETVQKLEEDVPASRRSAPVGYRYPRRVEVRFGQPVDVHDYVRARGLDAKSGVAPLTGLIAQRIQTLLEEPTGRTGTGPSDG